MIIVVIIIITTCVYNLQEPTLFHIPIKSHDGSS